MIYMSTTVEIVKTPDILHGKPRLSGTRIGVFMLGERVRCGGHTVDDLHEDHPDLSREQIDLALEYYHDHPVLMETLRMQRQAYKQRVSDQNRVPK